MADEKNKDDVTERVIVMFIDCAGWIKRDEVKLDAGMALELKVDGDDLTVFAEEVERYFDMRLTQNE